jgi:hypothetical protein
MITIRIYTAPFLFMLPNGTEDLEQWAIWRHR